MIESQLTARMATNSQLRSEAITMPDYTLAKTHVMLLMAFTLVTCPVEGARNRDWVYVASIRAGDLLNVRCFDKSSLTREGTIIRVWIGEGRTSSETCPAEFYFGQYEKIVRCADERAAITEGTDGKRRPEPPAPNDWVAARLLPADQKLVDAVCAKFSSLPDHGSPYYGAAPEFIPAPSPKQRAKQSSASAPPSVAPQADRVSNTTGPRKEPVQSATGSGLVVSSNGHVLTNRHVVVNCEKLFVSHADRRVQASVVGADQILDLALLRTGLSSGTIGIFSDKPVRIGETVAAAGYPLKGLLASGPILSTGTVNALGGIRNDATRIQISVPVQPGNSGGPLVDRNGYVVGVVVAKLDAVRVAQITGDIPQNINFAIKAELARAFMDANGVTPKTGNDTRVLDSVQISDAVRSIAVLVECWR